ITRSDSASSRPALPLCIPQPQRGSQTCWLKMQITAQLKAPVGRSDVTTSSRYFKATGSNLTDADGVPVAAQNAGVWRGVVGLFSWIDFKSPVIVNFKNDELGQAEKFGPAPFRMVNGC